jgi:peptide/nickel transport system substrate-binding protein
MNRRELLKSGAVTVSSGMLGLWPTIRAYAGTPLDTLVAVTEYGPNSLDIQGLGANQPTHGPSWNIYDRLLSYGTKTLPDGTPSYDYKSLTPRTRRVVGGCRGRHVGRVQAAPQRGVS